MQVSVITPCHNAAAYIEATLDSAAGQSHLPHELIVIDDASTDDSRARVRAWSEAHPAVPLQLLEVNVRNAAAARNAGIAAASGDWIAFLDADDVWQRHHLENAAALLENGSDVAFMANHYFMSEDGGDLAPIVESMKHGIGESGGGHSSTWWLELIERGFHFGHSTVLMRLDRARQVGAFDAAQRRRHDLDLWLRVTQGQTWAYHAQEAASYRIDTPGSISKDPLETEFFYLKALLKNRAGYPTATMENLIAVSARRLMSLAFVDGTRAQWRAARRLAWPVISPRLRIFYRLTRVAAPLFRAAIRLKRRLVWSRQNPWRPTQESVTRSLARRK